MTWAPPLKTISIPYQATVAWPDRGCGLPPPALPTTAMFGRAELGFSIARNITKSTVRPAVARTLAANASRLLGALIDRNGIDLRTLVDVNDLGDHALTTFAHDVAVGVAGLCMERLGFVWRAHAQQVLPRAMRPDYVWTHALAAGVTLSEVKGMAGSSGSFSQLRTRVRKGFNDQVGPWRSSDTPAGTPIVGGYAIGVRVSDTGGAQIAAVRSQPHPMVSPHVDGSPFRPMVPGPDPHVVAHHFAAAVALIGVGGLSRRILGLPPLPSPAVRLDIVDVGHLSFVVRHGRERMAVGMEERAFRFAMRLADGGDRPEPHATPPVYPAFSTDEEARPGRFPLLVLAPDGLALVDRRAGEARAWATVGG